jgi:hypothetical protein
MDDPDAKSIFSWSLPLVSDSCGLPLELLVRLVFACRVYPKHTPDRKRLLHAFVFRDQPEDSSYFTPDYNLAMTAKFVDKCLQSGSSRLPIVNAGPALPLTPPAALNQETALPRHNHSLCGANVLFPSACICHSVAADDFLASHLFSSTPSESLSAYQPFLLVPLSDSCSTCLRKLVFKRSFPAMVYSTGFHLSKTTRAATSFVFVCKSCNLVYHHGFCRLPATANDPHRRIQYDLDWDRYEFLAISPEFYVSLDWLRKLDFIFANKPVPFNSLANIFNQKQGIYTASDATKRLARNLHMPAQATESEVFCY